MHHTCTVSHCICTVPAPYLHPTCTILAPYLHRTFTVPAPYLHRTCTGPVPSSPFPCPAMFSEGVRTPSLEERAEEEEGMRGRGRVLARDYYRTCTIHAPYRIVPAPFLHRTCIVPESYLHRTLTVPAPYRTVPAPYLHRTLTVPGPYLHRTGTVPLWARFQFRFWFWF